MENERNKGKWFLIKLYKRLREIIQDLKLNERYWEIYFLCFYYYVIYIVLFCL